MFIVLAKVLWAFDVLPPVDENGVEEEVDTGDAAFDGEGSTTMSRVYRVRWVVRGTERKAVLENEVEQARREGFVLRGVKVGEGGVEVQG